jgi:hypothetical protein
MPQVETSDVAAASLPAPRSNPSFLLPAPAAPSDVPSRHLSDETHSERIDAHFAHRDIPSDPRAFLDMDRQQTAVEDRDGQRS